MTLCQRGDLFAFVLPLEAFNQVLLRWQKVLVATLQPNRSQQSTSVGETKRKRCSNDENRRCIDEVVVVVAVVVAAAKICTRKFVRDVAR